MKLFARKPSTEPTLPPELQPYYGKPSRFVWWKQMSARSKGVVLLAVALVVALIGLLIWVATRDNTSSTTQTNSGNPAATQSPQQNKALNKDTGKPADTPLSNDTFKSKPTQ
jgi:hypothetical protein